jgi:uncharacterized lipoprotein YddW (UPF0748 family)
MCFTLISCNEKNSKIINPEGKVALMWFDAEANFSRFSNKDSIDYYLEKVANLGFTHAVVCIRPISGEVLYDSKIAPRMTKWLGDEEIHFDYLGHFIQKAHALGMEVHASLNIFVAGHNYYDRGLVYSGHHDWATIVYNPERGLIPIYVEKRSYSAMVNPINEDYREHILSVLKEVAHLYPALDGIIIDRARYDGIRADFSDFSKKEFEKYIGEEVVRFPEDIYEWVKTEDGKYNRENGKHFLKWAEWRAKNIYDFFVLAHNEIKSVNPNISFGTYTGAWYPSYYEVGVNFASNTYDPSKDFDWATPEYKNFGYAEVLDLYTTGNYYTNISEEDYFTNNSIIRNETDSREWSGLWYTVEGSNRHLRNILGDNEFSGGILADQFYENPDGLRRSIEMNLTGSDGVMVFDIVHIITKNMWNEVELGMRNGGMIR